jgi:hypothetical protein
VTLGGFLRSSNFQCLNNALSSKMTALNALLLQNENFSSSAHGNGIRIAAYFVRIRLIVIELKRRLESLIEQSNLFLGQFTDEVGQHGFGEAYKLITVNTAIMLQSLINPNRDLGGEVLAGSVYGRTDNG